MQIRLLGPVEASHEGHAVVWNAALRDGSVLSFEEAIAYALEERSGSVGRGGAREGFSGGPS